MSKEFKCEDCRNFAKKNYCAVCIVRKSPSGKESKPTLWEEKVDDDFEYTFYKAMANTYKAITLRLANLQPIGDIAERYDKLIKLFNTLGGKHEAEDESEV